VNVPGIRDLLEPGRTGDLWPRGDAAALAVLLRRYREDRALRQQAGAEAARRAQRLTSAALAQALGSLYGI